MTPADRPAASGHHQEPHFGDFTSSPPPAERGNNAPPPPVERVPVDVEPDQEAPFAAMPEFSERELQADTLAFEPVRRRSAANWSWVKWAMVLVVVASGAIAGWKYWGRDWWAMRNSGDEIPLVHAVDGPFKVRPEQPGGADFANRDKLVYQELEKGGAALPKTESLLPQPEKPLPPPAPRNPPAQRNTAPMTQQQAAADPMSQEGAAPAITGGEGEGEETEDDGPTVVATPSVVPPMTAPAAGSAKAATPPPAPPASVATTSSLRPSPSEVRAAQPPAPPPAPPAVKTDSDPTVAVATPQVSANPRGYRIQISAVRSEADARTEWLRLRKQYDAVLGKLTLFVERADLGSKGVFYRIQAGAFNDKPAAEAACQQLVKQKVGCLVVRPEG